MLTEDEQNRKLPDNQKCKGVLMSDLGSTGHPHKDDLELYVRGRLEPGLTLTIEPHLRGCIACRERLAECIGLELNVHPTGTVNSNGGHDRSEVRFNTGDEGALQELNPLSFDRQKVQIVDISKNGLGMLATKSVLPGTIVQVRIGTTVELGEVRHCSGPRDHGYRIDRKSVV